MAIAQCSGCKQTRKVAARGLCWDCYMDKQLRPYAPLPKKYRLWTPAEVALLKRYRPLAVPLKELARLLPGRSENEIKNKSVRLKLRHKRGRRNEHGYCSVCDTACPALCKKFGWIVKGTRPAEKYCPDCWHPSVYVNRPKDSARPVLVGQDTGPKVYSVSREAV